MAVIVSKWSEVAEMLRLCCVWVRLFIYKNNKKGSQSCLFVEQVKSLEVETHTYGNNIITKVLFNVAQHHVAVILSIVSINKRVLA